MYLNLSWPLANITLLSIMQHIYTHKHTHLTIQQSVSLFLFSLSVWLSVWPGRGYNALLWRCCVWLSLPACHIHLEREGKGKLGGVWRQWVRKTHTAFPAHVLWVNSVRVCVCFRSCLSSRDPYCIWLSAGNCATVAPGFKWVKATSHDPSIIPATVNTFTVR